jgi:tape measure domain-containing protein
MAKLYFKVGSDWEEVVRLRNEIAKLKQELMSMDGTQSPAAFKALNVQLAASNQRLDELVTNAAKAGAEMETGFKRKIFDASQSVNGFTEKILAQKAVVKDIESDVKRLGDAYRIALKRNPLSANSKLEEYNAARKALDEEKAALFGLTQQQAEARLSVKKLRDEYALYNDNAKEIVESNNGIAISWKKALAVIGGAGVLKALGSEMIRIRGEFQSMQTAIETMVGKDMAGQLIPQIKELAKISPLTMSDMVGAEKMMLGFNIQAEDTIKYLKAISDISMGESSKFNSLTLAFSQMSAAGKLMGQDLNQMINAGFNPLQIISEKTGKSIATLKDEMSKGAVSAEMVQQAFIDATSAGGKFYNMSENASKTINGQLSMMQDAWDNALNEIGKSSEGFIMSGIQATTSLIQNYETIGKILVGMLATYGVYKTALITNITLTRGWAVAARTDAVAKGIQTIATKAQTVAQLALNSAMKANPYVLAATLIMGAASAMWAFHDSTTATERAEKQLNNTIDIQKQQLDELKGKVNSLVSIIKNESASQFDKIRAYKQLQSLMPTVFSNMDIEKLKLLDILSVNKQISEEINRRERIGAKTRLVMAQNKVNNINALISEDSKRGTYYGQYESQLSEAKAEQEVAQKYVDDLLKIQSEANKKKKQEDEKEEIRNKEYWENKKKQAEDARNALDVSKKNSEEWNKYTKQIQEAQKQIDKYSDSKSDRISEKQVKDQQKLAEELLSLRRNNQQAEIELMKEGTEKELKQIDLNYQKKLDAIKKKEKELSERQGGKLTQEQSIEISALYINAENERDKAIADVTKNQLKTEADAMREYLKEYGTFQQKKEAITKEYNDKIANATTEGDKKILQKQMEEALSSVDMDKLKQEINWELIFSDLNKVSKKSLEQVKQQLKTFKNSDEYKNMAVDQKKVIDEALNNIQSTIIDKGGLLGDLPEQLDALRIAQDELKQAQDEYNKSLKSGTDAEKEAALKKKNKAEKNVQNAETNVTRSADKTYQNLITLADTITQLGSSSEMSLSQIGSLASGLIDTFTEAGSKIGGIVGAVFSLLDGIEKQGFDGFVKNVFSSVFGAGASMWNTITFGGFNKLFGIGGNAKEVQDTIDRLTDRNETLQTAIEDLTDVMEASKGTKSVAAYTDAKKLQEETEENYKKIAQEQARYSNSHHSWNYYWGGFNQDEIARLSSQIGRNWNGDIWSLSPEEMKMLRSNVDMWEKIQNTGKGNYGGRLTEKLNDYIDQAGKMEELTNKLYEGLTGISFESMYDSFIDTLMDMDASAEDAADNIADYFMRAMLSNKIGELYSDKLEAWWKKFGKSMEDNELTESEREALQNEYMQYVEEAMKIRDEIAAATGYTGSSSSSSQEASKKGFATASQDSIDELNGRFTSLQIAGEEIKNQSVAQSQSLNILTMKADALISINTETRNIADDTRDLIASSYLELVQISENTGAIIKPIQQMQKDIAEVKNNTKGLSTK